MGRLSALYSLVPLFMGLRLMLVYAAPLALKFFFVLTQTLKPGPAFNGLG
jgi:hypothetical protein